MCVLGDLGSNKILGIEMTDVQQFWAEWWVQFAAAVATFLAVLVALFGQAFRGKFFPPKLRSALADARGERTRVRLRWIEEQTPVEREEDARYYHLRVWNDRRWSPAQQTQVVLLRVDEPDAGGVLVPIWTGDIPLGWRHQSVTPLQRTIGPEAYADICSVVRGKWLQVHTLIQPNNLATVRRAACILVVHLQARSSEVDSKIVRIRIAWDGDWHDGAEEMKRHLKIEELREPVA
jgi:hypothetical protein